MSNARKYRAFLGMTQEEMANRLGISLSSYRNKENERTAFSDAEKVVFKNIVSSEIGNTTIDEIFFAGKVQQK